MRSVIIFACILVVAAMVNADCPVDEAFKHNGYYYQIFDCPLPWDKAEDKCNNEMTVNGTVVSGGHLVSILDAKEKDWLKYVLNVRYSNQIGIWIGGHRRRDHFGTNECPKRLRWTDGSALDYKNFDDARTNCGNNGELSYQLPNTKCFMIETVRIDDINDGWMDAECQLPMRFVCKLKSA